MFFNPEMLVRLEEPAGKMAATDGKKAASQQPKSGPNIGSLGAAVTGAGFDPLLAPTVTLAWAQDAFSEAFHCCHGHRREENPFLSLSLCHCLCLHFKSTVGGFDLTNLYHVPSL